MSLKVLLSAILVHLFSLEVQCQQVGAQCLQWGWACLQVIVHVVASAKMFVSRCLQVVKSTPLVVGWNYRVFSAGLTTSNTEGGADRLVEEAHAYSVKPATSPFRKGSNWNYRAELSALATRLGHEAEGLPSLVKALYQESRIGVGSKVGQIIVKPNRLSVLGRSTMMHYVNEYIYFTYPEMDGQMLIDISAHLTNQDALVKIANHVGVTDLIQTKVDLSSGLSSFIISQSFCGVVGAVFKDQGPSAVKKLVCDLVMTQLATLDLQETLKLQHPRFMLKKILSSQGRPKPVSRLISESGRATHFPSFVVGVFSGEDCLGEGTGTSLRRAELEAMCTALQTHFQKELSACALPSDNEDFSMETELKERVVV